MKRFFLAALLGILLAGPALAETIRVGVTPGPHGQMLEAVKKVDASK